MATRPLQRVSYGLTEALSDMAPRPIIANDDPTVADKAQLGTIWINRASSTVFILAGIAVNQATWVEVTPGGGTGDFTSVTVADDLTTDGGGDVTLVSDGDLALTSTNGALDIATQGLINFGAVLDTQAGTASTIDANVGVATFTGQTIANGATQTFTITNAEVTATSGIIIGIADTATAATEFVAVKQVPGAGSFTVVVRNDGVTQADGDIVISFIIL